jgi:hypothetical protein
MEDHGSTDEEDKEHDQPGIGYINAILDDDDANENMLEMTLMMMMIS